MSRNRKWITGVNRNQGQSLPIRGHDVASSRSAAAVLAVRSEVAQNQVRMRVLKRASRVRQQRREQAARTYEGFARCYSYGRINPDRRHKTTATLHRHRDGYTRRAADAYVARVALNRRSAPACVKGDEAMHTKESISRHRAQSGGGS